MKATALSRLAKSKLQVDDRIELENAFPFTVEESDELNTNGEKLLFAPELNDHIHPDLLVIEP